MVNIIARNGQPFCPIRHAMFFGMVYDAHRRNVKRYKINAVGVINLFLLAIAGSKEKPIIPMRRRTTICDVCVKKR